MIKYSKYHGCGNNFIIIHDLGLSNYTNLAIKMCDEKTGIGADGLIIVKTNPYEMLFYNRDGKEGSMCGNGMRCFIAYLYDELLLTNNEVEVITKAGLIKGKIINQQPFLIQVDLGLPVFNNQLCGLISNHEPYILQEYYYEGKCYYISVLFVGVSHTVCKVNSITDIMNSSLGEELCHHPLFKDGTNVDFVEIINENEIKVMTYERGVGWTASCGTGSCASYFILRLLHLVNEKVKVNTLYGTLIVNEENNHLLLSGPAVKICQGLFYDK